MSYQDRIAVVAAEDHASNQYKAVGIDGLVAGTVIAAFGSLQEAPASGEDCSLAYQGRMKMKAGGAVTKGDLLGVNSTAFFVTVTSGALSCGKALETVTSGSIFEGIGNFAGQN